ncbi:N2227-domain-containing protein [Jaminaea rosea]|uniref:carnosine N-methyltransferase n=1 Tax=Jaminaea rosea TaxID=1569628 RepID=A0A316US02_9BASI|nr:N2227-domain-containing protein [Jaminaea rosea]PWN26653.1 N2227-domain-containing protein [Jaminaea rosea]
MTAPAAQGAQDRGGDGEHIHTHTNGVSSTAGQAAAAASSSSAPNRESEHIRTVLSTFEAYLPYSLATNNIRRRSYNALSRRHRNMLADVGATLPRPTIEGGGGASSSREVKEGSRSTPPNLWGDRGIKARLAEIDDRIRRNADFLDLVVAQGREFLGEDKWNPELAGGDNGCEGSAAGAKGAAVASNSSPPRDLDKVRSTLKQLVRDWSEQGKEERLFAYQPILEALEAQFPLPRTQRNRVRVLFPGCGLGRLPWEAAMRGFTSQGNEYSLYMLLSSHLILNKTSQARTHRIYPWVGSMSNWRSAAHLLEEVDLPDVHPGQLLARSPRETHFSMAAGDFVKVYGAEEQRGKWDSVCTSFFLDTARNPLSYLETIHSTLREGGVWINLGPLLWHFEGTGPEKKMVGDEFASGSIELTLEEVMDLMEKVGFVVEERRTMPRQSYTGNARSMLTYEYECEFWVARKVGQLGDEGTAASSRSGNGSGNLNVTLSG